MELPNGSSIEHTAEVTTALDAFIDAELKIGSARKEGVTSWADFIGQGGPRFNLRYTPEPMKPEYAFLIVNATSRKIVDSLIPKLEDYCARTFPDLKVTAKLIAYGPRPSALPWHSVSRGKTPTGYSNWRSRSRPNSRPFQARGMFRMTGVSRSKKLLVRVDQTRARLAGVTSRDIAVSLQTLLSGIEGNPVSRGRQGHPRIHSFHRLRPHGHRTCREPERLLSHEPGRAVPLKQVADIEVAWEPAKILRRDAIRTVTVECDLAPGVRASAVNARIVPWLEKGKQRLGLGLFLGNRRRGGEVRGVQQVHLRQPSPGGAAGAFPAGFPVQFVP